MPRRKRLLPRRYLLSGLACVALLLVPFPTTMVPEWRVQVINRQGHVLRGEFVRQSWTDYSLESCCGDMDDAWADESGYVVFPRRVIWASLLARTVKPPLAKLMTLAHGSAGVHADVTAWGRDGVAVSVRYEPGVPPPDKIVLPY